LDVSNITFLVFNKSDVYIHKSRGTMFRKEGWSARYKRGAEPWIRLDKLKET
jgi:hypothetical protein